MATFSELRQLLDYRSLGAVYEEYGRSISPNPLYDFYVGEGSQQAQDETQSVVGDLSDPADIQDAVRSLPSNSSAGGGSVERVDTDTVEYIFLGRVKSAAPLNKRGAAARLIQPTGADARKVTLAHVFNELRLGFDSLRALREPDNWTLQKLGRTEVMKQLQDFGTRHMMTKRVFLAKALADGVVYTNFEGQILESSTGAEQTIDLGVPASHKSQLNIGGNVISAAWDVAGTDILGQLDNLTYAAEVENVDPPKHIWLNSQNKKWFRLNTELKAYYSGVRPLNELLNEDTVEINGYVFHFFGGTYTDASGSTQPFIPLTKAIITPDLGPWFMNAIGLEYVPTSIDIAGSTDEALANVVEQYGPFAYSKFEHNPPRLSVYMGDNFMYAFRNPKSIWIPTIDF